jgi:hypothetical protein
VNPLYTLIARRADHRCEYCRAPEVAFNFPFEVEHVVPTSQGGSGDPSNLALACRACNARKGDALTGTDEATGEDTPLFNPRTDRWSEHFEFDQDSGRLVGLSPVGRATITRLDMNHPLQLIARDMWIRLRLYA